MSLQKKERIRRYLTRNGGKRLNDLIHHRLRVQDISRRFDTSKQLTYLTLSEMGYDDIQKRRYEYLQAQCRHIYHLLYEGLPLDDLWDYGDLACFDIDISKKMSIVNIKQVIIRKFQLYDVITLDDVDARKRIITAPKFQSYIELIQAGYMIQRNEHYMTEIASFFNSSYTRIHDVKTHLHDNHTPLHRLPKPLVKVLCRNIRICLDSRIKDISIEDIADTYQLDETLVTRIIHSTLPYVVTTHGLELMPINPFDL